MNLSTIKNFGGPIVGRAILRVQKYAPEILTVVGIAGGVTAAVLGAKATLRVETVLQNKDDRLEILDELKRSTLDRDPDEFDEKEYLRDKTGIYTHFVLDMTKLYGPSVSLGIASIVSIVCAHGIMRRRNVALMAAYKTVETAFSTYRQRLIEEFGAEKDQDYRAGVYTEKTEDPETGKKTTKKRFDVTDISGYARIFDESNPNYDKTPDLNRMFLVNMQMWMNDKLRARGHVFLNEVYDALGFERTHAGAVVGWIMQKDGEGDNYVDFGIYNDSERANAFINGMEKSILLDFNVDGVILDYI